MNGTDITYDGYPVTELKELFSTYRDRHDDESENLEWSVFGKEEADKVGAAISLLLKKTATVETRSWVGDVWMYENGETLSFDGGASDMFILTA